MASILNPYLAFHDNARQAFEFYRSALGGELNISTFGEAGVSDDEAYRDRVMHAHLTSAKGFTLMGADTPPGMEFTPGTAYAVSLSGDDEAELRGYWEKLSDGGTVLEPLAQAPWGDSFGMCVDPFGVRWMVNISPKQ